MPVTQLRVPCAQRYTIRQAPFAFPSVLQAACAGGRVSLIEHREVSGLQQAGGAWRLLTTCARKGLALAPALPAGAAYFSSAAAGAVKAAGAASHGADSSPATATASNGAESALGGGQQKAAAAPPGVAMLDAASGIMPLGCPSPSPEPSPVYEGELEVDLVWLATGRVYDAMADPVLLFISSSTNSLGLHAA